MANESGGENVWEVTPSLMGEPKWGLLGRTGDCGFEDSSGTGVSAGCGVTQEEKGSGGSGGPLLHSGKRGALGRGGGGGEDLRTEVDLGGAGGGLGCRDAPGGMLMGTSMYCRTGGCGGVRCDLGVLWQERGGGVGGVLGRGAGEGEG